MAAMQAKGFTLHELKNMMITAESRPRVDVFQKVRLHFAGAGLDRTAINTVYSHVLNPMVASRSYMCIEPIELWLDTQALRRGLILLPCWYRTVVWFQCQHKSPSSTLRAESTASMASMVRSGLTLKPVSSLSTVPRMLSMLSVLTAELLMETRTFSTSEQETWDSSTMLADPLAPMALWWICRFCLFLETLVRLSRSMV
ncbi:hypothetical protein LB505_000264 [Fusarium chuoi]|nr:hypothetical protein LB505_000264 [Fusarium chuoi]